MSNSNSTTNSNPESILREKILNLDCLRSVLNPQNLNKLPKEVQTDLLKLLPSVDQSLNSSALNNSFFNSACKLYLEKLPFIKIKSINCHEIPKLCIPLFYMIVLDSISAHERLSVWLVYS